MEWTVDPQVAGQPLLGHGRGRYTPAELRAIDAAAADWGLEVVACIQTLGHLEQLLQVRALLPEVSRRATWAYATLSRRAREACGVWKSK
jgi:hypothetical protein